ncbi:MAG: desulfoferrodoxin family protein [Anaerovoracaceae bacterium]|jgi:superoxide reductase|nr:desulfoferrodoxin [Clostridiales bacterium]
MSKEPKFFLCEHCGNLMTLLEESGVPVVCCGDEMTELVAGTSDGSYEKHVPDVKVDGSKVTIQVGSVLHPMVPEHYIAWIYLYTNLGGQFKYLEVGKDPIAEFALSNGETAIAAFEYCNLHGLWKADI